MVGVLLITATGAIAYATSFAGDFVLDDHSWILDNVSLRDSGNWRAVVFPSNAEQIGGRPVVSLTLAVNYWLAAKDEGGRPSAWGFHAVNLALHLLAAVTLFGLTRRTLGLLPSSRDKEQRATWIALAISLLWVVHPLTTAAVTYVIQRSESLASLFYLLTVYCTLRGATVPDRGDGRSGGRWWYVAAVAACWLGVGTKEVVATAPLAVWLYDRTFLAGGFVEALRRRWGLYAALAGSWVILLGLLMSAGFHGAATGFAVREFTCWSYLATQPGVILHYLKLSAWPAQMSLDSGWPAATSLSAIFLPGAIVVGLLAATIWGIVRKQAWSFPAAMFFLFLAPTSSFVPIKDAEFDYRMYLPLASVIALIVFSAYKGLRRIPGGWALPVAATVAGLLICGLGFLTFQRNRDYRSEDAIWQDTLAKYPHNLRAMASLGYLCGQRGELDQAVDWYERALQERPDERQVSEYLVAIYKRQGNYSAALSLARHLAAVAPEYPDVHTSLAGILNDVGQTDEAVRHFRRAIELNPAAPAPRVDLADVVLKQGNADEAISLCKSALELDPYSVGALVNLGNAEMAKGQVDQALVHLRRAISLSPNNSEALFNYGVVMARRHSYDDAISALQRAHDLRPADVEIEFVLAETLDESGRPEDAADHLRNVAQAAAKMAKAPSEKQKQLVRYGCKAQIQLGYRLTRKRQFDQATEHFQAAVALCPEDRVARRRLGVALATSGKLVEAQTELGKLVEAEPDDAELHKNLGNVYFLRRNQADALRQWREAARLNPKDSQTKINVALILATSADARIRNGAEAVELAEQAVLATQNKDANAIAVLAAAQAEAGQFQAAVESARRARDLALRNGETALAETITPRLKLYESGQPFHQPAAAD